MMTMRSQRWSGSRFCETLRTRGESVWSSNRAIGRPRSSAARSGASSLAAVRPPRMKSQLFPIPGTLRRLAGETDQDQGRPEMLCGRQLYSRSRRAGTSVDLAVVFRFFFSSRRRLARAPARVALASKASHRSPSLRVHVVRRRRATLSCVRVSRGRRRKTIASPKPPPS